MVTYGIPDLTGLNPSYLNVNIPINVYQLNMRYTFDRSPVYADSIIIHLVNEDTTLIRGIDWDYNSEDINQNAIARARLEVPTFGRDVINSIIFISQKSVGKIVSMNYQDFYRTVPGIVTTDGTPLEVTPELIKYLIDSTANLRQQVSSVTSPVVSNFTEPSNLKFDINKTNPDNVVVAEKFTVNTVAGAKVLRLGQGLFFGKSVTIVQNSVALNPETDFTPIVVSELTARTTDTGGIYHFLLLNKEIVGDIYVTYHAVGGEVQQSDIESVYILMSGIRDFLSSGKLLTTDSITQSPAFSALDNRIQVLEDNMRILLDGTPTYGDSTSGDITVRTVRAPDSNFHWWTIAKLYQVSGSSTVVTADRFKGRVFFPGANVAVTFSAETNLTVSRNPVTFSTEALLIDPLYDLFNSVSVATPVYPVVRVIWNNDGVAFSGALLQIGLRLASLSDTMIVEDLSTSESCWILDKTGQAVGSTPATPTDPSDNNVTLPNGSSTWTSGGGISYSETYVPKFDKGYLVYQGSGVNLGTVKTSASTSANFNSVLPTSLPVKNFKEIVVTLVSADNNTVYDVIVPITGTTNTSRTGVAAFRTSTGEVLSMKVTLSSTLGATSQIAINVDEHSTSVSGGSVSIALTDIIRYIRARV